MTAFPGDETPDRHLARMAGLTDSDRALLLARMAWGEPCASAEVPDESNDASANFLAGFQDRLAPARLRILRAALGRDQSSARSGDPRTAIDELRRMHRAMVSVDLARVHPTWLVRALREESPAVQRLVATSLPGSIGKRVQEGLSLDSQELVRESATDPEIASWVMALWTERLVGGEVDRASDPPVLVMLGGLSPREGYRLCRMAGLCKLVLAGQPRDGRCAASAQIRREWLAARLAQAGEQLLVLARHDVELSRASSRALRHQTAWLGLLTASRLLADCEPFRQRWALQHWPYPVAKMIRSVMQSSAGRPPSLIEGESLILKTAWDRLDLEGRLTLACPELYLPQSGAMGTIAGQGQGRPSQTSLFNRV